MDNFRYLGGGDFTGRVFCSTLKGKFFKAFSYKNGQLNGKFGVLRRTDFEKQQNVHRVKEYTVLQLYMEKQISTRTYSDSYECTHGGNQDDCNYCLDEVVVTPCKGGCGETEYNCSCPQCSKCGFVGVDCICMPCAKCFNKGDACSCTLCGTCNNISMDCSCPLCYTCGKKGQACTCEEIPPEACTSCGSTTGCSCGEPTPPQPCANCGSTTGCGCGEYPDPEQPYRPDKPDKPDVDVPATGDGKIPPLGEVYSLKETDVVNRKAMKNLEYRNQQGKEDATCVIKVIGYISKAAGGDLKDRDIMNAFVDKLTGTTAGDHISKDEKKKRKQIFRYIDFDGVQSKDVPNVLAELLFENVGQESFPYPTYFGEPDSSSNIFDYKTSLDENNFIMTNYDDKNNPYSRGLAHAIMIVGYIPNSDKSIKSYIYIDPRCSTVYYEVTPEVLDGVSDFSHKYHIEIESLPK